MEEKLHRPTISKKVYFSSGQKTKDFSRSFINKFEKQISRSPSWLN